MSNLFLDVSIITIKQKRPTHKGFFWILHNITNKQHSHLCYKRCKTPLRVPSYNVVTVYMFASYLKEGFKTVYNHTMPEYMH